MSTLGARDLRAVLDTAAALAEVERWGDMAAVTPLVCRLLGADGFIYHQVNVRTRVQVDVFYPDQAYTLRQFESYAAVFPEHPFVQQATALVSAQVLRLSDLTPRPAWRSSRVYVDALRGLGIDDQMACVLEVEEGLPREAWTCFRSGAAFTLRDRSSLQSLRPHLVATFRRLRRHGGPWLAMQVTPEPRLVQIPRPRAKLPLLTPREQEVMVLLATGRTISQAARLLGCGARTVEKHVEHIHAKLGATGRVDAIARWQHAQA